MMQITKPVTCYFSKYCIEQYIICFTKLCKSTLYQIYLCNCWKLNLLKQLLLWSRMCACVCPSWCQPKLTVGGISWIVLGRDVSHVHSQYEESFLCFVTCHQPPHPLPYCHLLLHIFLKEMDDRLVPVLSILKSEW